MNQNVNMISFAEQPVDNTLDSGSRQEIGLSNGVISLEQESQMNELRYLHNLQDSRAEMEEVVTSTADEMLVENNEDLFENQINHEMMQMD